MKRLIILTGSPLCHNPRVIKEATALAATGFSVEVLGAWLDPELKARDQALLARLPFRFTPVLDAATQPWEWRKCRLCVKLARLWHQYTGRESVWQLGYVTHALARTVRTRRHQTDLFIAHSEPALWAVSQLQNRKSEIGNRKCAVGVDMEDWFSEDLPLETRRHRPVKLLRSLEQNVLCKGQYATCTSRAMSEALAKEYGCRPPTVM